MLPNSVAWTELLTTELFLAEDDGADRFRAIVVVAPAK